MNMKYRLPLAIVLFLVVSCSFSQDRPIKPAVPVTGQNPPNMEAVAVHPHDVKAFTQGLLYDGGFLYESTGMYGESSLRKVELKTGRILMSVPIPERFFSEGIAFVGDKIYMLTWQEGVCLVFDKNTFQFLEQFSYSGEGWGLTYDGEHLILSDGTDTLRFVDPKTFKVKRKLQVVIPSVVPGKKAIKLNPVRNINELEMIHGEIWANVWQLTDIVRIDPKSGNVLGTISAASLVPEQYKRELSSPGIKDHVLNGIAFDPETNRVFLTGKKWPTLFELKIGDAKK